MRRILFTFILSCICISPGWGQSNQPFVDLNIISKIEQTASRLVFHSPAGKKSLNIRSGEWSYALNPDARFHGAQPRQNFYSRPSIKIDMPDWYQKPTYLKIVAVDDINTPRWLLTANAGGGATYSSQNLIDVKNRRVYRLPYEEFVSFTIDSRFAWVAGERGICRIDLGSLERVNYLTLPSFDSIVAQEMIDNQLYYLTRSFGLFAVMNTGEISPITDVNVYAQRGFKFLSALQAKGRLWLLAVEMDPVGRYIKRKEAMLLLNVDPKSGSVSAINTKIPYARHLILRHNELIGYGSRTEWYEGGDSVTFGGAFRYNIQTATLKVLAKLPITNLQLDPPRALSISVNDGPQITVKHLESPNLETPFRVSRSEWIADRDSDVQGYKFNSSVKVVYKGERARYKELYQLSLRDKELISEKLKLKNLETFGALRIQLRTVVTPAGRVAVDQH